MANYITKDLETHIKGTTYKGIGFLISTGESIDSISPLPISYAKMQLKLAYNAPASLTLESGAGLTTDPSSPGLIVIDKQIIDVPAGNYIYDIEITTEEGDVFIYIKGSWLITQDVTS